MGKAKTKQHLAYTILFLPPTPRAGGRARRGRVLEAAGPDVVPSMLGARRGVQEEELNGGQGEEQVLGGGVRWARPAEDQIVDAVVLARILGAALLVPVLQINAIRGDQRYAFRRHLQNMASSKVVSFLLAFCGSLLIESSWQCRMLFFCVKFFLVIVTYFSRLFDIYYFLPQAL